MMTHATYAGAFRPVGRGRAAAYDAALVLAGSVLIALSARAAFYLFGLVPVTGQTFAVALVGALLGSRRGAAAAALYVLQGACGLPVFAGGAAGPAYLVGPTGGYLLGFILAAGAIGLLAERGWDRRFATTVAAMAIGDAALFVPGVIWLAVFVGPAAALVNGLLLFLPVEVVKVGLAAWLLPAGWKLLRRPDETP